MKTYLEPEEIDLLEANALTLNVRTRWWEPCLMYQLLVRIPFRLGCRISEALGISVDDIDFTRGTVTIQHLKLRVKLSCPDCGAGLSKAARYCPGCGKAVSQALAREKEHQRFRALPLDEKTLDMLRDYIDQGGPVSRKGKQLLFGINRHRAWQIVRECAERAGLPRLVNPETGKMHNVSPHRLRDAFAVNAVKQDDSGDGLRKLQEYLGHQSITTTMRYRKVSGEEQKEWYQKLWR